MLVVEATFPAPGASDVAEREVTLSVTLADGTAIDPVTITKPVAETSFTFTVASGATIVASQVDYDASGNASPATTSGPFVAADTFPPPAPGQIAFAVIGQTE